MAKLAKRTTINVRPVTLDRRVRQILDSRLEHKRSTSVGAFADLSTSGVVNPITSALAQGDDITGRTGDLIRMGKLKLRLELQSNSGTVGLAYAVRFIVFQDTLCNGAVPAVTDLLDSANVLSGYNVVNRQSGRFKVLHDSMLTSVSGTPSARVCREIDIRMKGVQHYIGSAGAAASLGRNSPFVLIVSDAASAGVYRYSWSYDYDFTDA